MNPLEQQLKRLCEVDPQHFRAHKHDSDVSWAAGFKPGLALWLDDNGQLQGGEALWFMFDSMRRRYLEIRNEDWFEGKGYEAATMNPLFGHWFTFDAELILSTYIAWFQSSPRRVQVDILQQDCGAATEKREE